MGLTSALQIGRSALTASQVAIQVTGNNFANAATPGYSRQMIGLAPAGDSSAGSYFLGRGVSLTGVRRQIDGALQGRLFAGYSHESAMGTNYALLAGVQTTLNELSDSDLSSELSRFFNSWSELANTPGAPGARSLVVQQGTQLAAYMRTLRGDLTAQRASIDRQLGANVTRADQLLSGIADLNREISTSEAGQGQSNGLRDQRDALIAELSTFLEVSTVEHPSGEVNVLVGSTPVVLGGESRGLQLVTQNSGSSVSVSIATRDDDERLAIASGSLGAMLGQRETLVNDTLNRLDAVSAQLIDQVNRVHASGYSSGGLTSSTGTLRVGATDRTRALNDPANATLAGLPFHPGNGSFLVTVRNTATGSTETVRVDIDLDGITNSGAAGFGDDTSITSLAATLDGVANLSATVSADGTLNITSAEGFTFGFAEDTSGVLATLGVNTFFTGSNASDIAVRSELETTPSLLNTGQIIAGNPNDNGAALAIATLQDRGLSAFGGQSIRAAWQEAVQSVGLRTGAAQTRAASATIVRENLEAQRAAVSGVSMDEESINLLTYQQQYQGAARFISVVDELTQTLFQIT